MILIGCDSNLSPDPNKLEKAHPATVGSTFTVDQLFLDSLGNVIPDHYRNSTFVDSIVSNGSTIGLKKNVTTFIRKQEGSEYTYYYNFEENGDISICYSDNGLVDSFWTTYPIESRIPIVKHYYDSSLRTGYVTRSEYRIEYDSTVNVVIAGTTLKAHKIRTKNTYNTDTKTGYFSISIYTGHYIIVPSIGYIAEWRDEPGSTNGWVIGSEGVVQILRDYHIQ